MMEKNRPFHNASEMNKEILSHWNQIVKEEDSVYILGDFGADGHEKPILNQLNGKKYLVKGNHGTQSNEYYRNAGFQEVYDYPIIIENFWILSHEPLYVNTNMPYANLFGHVHNSPMIKTYSKQHYCVSAERIGYTPIAFDVIISKIREDATQGNL